MSKIGNLPITVPEGVSVETEDRVVSVTGPKGALKRKLPRVLTVNQENGVLTVIPKNERDTTRALQGTFRSLIASMVKGVNEGWEKKLELVGTGYRAETSGKKLTLHVGYSHPIEIEAPDDVSFAVEKTVVTVTGIDKEVVGQVSADIRKARPPEPYKGEGIKYSDEVIIRKAGKAAKAQG